MLTRELWLIQMPDDYLDAAEQAEKSEVGYHPILTDFALADRFGWDEHIIERNREPWLTEIECALMADNMVKGAIHDEVRSKRANKRKESHDHEDASTKGKSLAKVRAEYAAMGMMPEDATDEEVAAMIGRVG